MSDLTPLHDSPWDGPIGNMVAGPDAEASPLDTVLMISGGYCVSRALHTVADLGIADAVGDGSMPIEHLAHTMNLNPAALGRILRLLSAHGVFVADDGAVTHNEASRLLRSDHPQSARALARMFGMPVFWNSFQDMSHSVATGSPAVARIFPEGVWGWLAARPEASAIFDQAMVAKSHAQVASVVQTYDFSKFATVADVGGGRGQLLRAILERCPRTSGVLFDQPHVVEQAGAIESERLTLVAGDFFRDDLPACDAYVLMEVIHDWNDEESRAILATVARAAEEGCTLLLVEQLMPETSGPHWVKMLDAHMLTLFGARQRSRAEYEHLLLDTGFQPQRAIETFSGATILEAVRV